MTTETRYCEMYETLEEAQEACQCQCEEPEQGTTFYRCSHRNCCGHHCEKCGKFEVVN